MRKQLEHQKQSAPQSPVAEHCRAFTHKGRTEGRGCLLQCCYPWLEFPWVLLVATNQPEWLLLRGIFSVQRSPTIHPSPLCVMDVGWWQEGGGLMVWAAGGSGGCSRVCLDGLRLYTVIPSPPSSWLFCLSSHPDISLIPTPFSFCLITRCFDYVGSSLKCYLVGLHCITCAGFVTRKTPAPCSSRTKR